LLAGLEQPNHGRVFVGGKDITSTPPKDRDMAMVFQNYALYPHMSVAENMGFALKIAGVAKSEIESAVKRVAEQLGLEELLDRKPEALSGGQRQRVAMGRAIVRKPQVFLMDEPLSNLDAKLRVQTRTQIATLQKQLGVTTIYVTHDQTEAMTMGDRVAVLKDGVLQQVDTPRAIYDKPINSFVASFIGSPAMNMIEVDFDESGAKVAGSVVPLCESVIAQAREQKLETVLLGFRPEDGVIGDRGFELEVTHIESLGADAYSYGTIFDRNGHACQVTARTTGRNAPQRNTQVRIEIDPAYVHVFNPATTLRLGD
jgi:multiple sugar transport system ATP-binding protein